MKRILDRFFGSRAPESVQPELPQKSLMELADEYIALMGPYDRSAQEVRGLKRRLCKLMEKHEIKYIARKDCLVRTAFSMSFGWFVEIDPLPPRLDGQVMDAPAAHLIPLVDRLLKADGGYGRDSKRREAAGALVCEAMEAEGRELFLYQGYQFRKSYKDVNVDRVVDFDG